MYIIFSATIIIILIFLIYKNYAFIIKHFKFFFSLIIIFLIPFFFFYNSTEKKNSSIECVDCTQNLIELFYFTKEQIFLTTLEFEPNVKKGCLNEFDYYYKNQMNLFLNHNSVYNLTKNDFKNLDHDDVSIKMLELHNLFDKINSLNSQFLITKINYEEVIFKNNLTENELNVLKKNYLIAIDNLFK